MTPKENYLMMLRGEIPDFMPSFYEPHGQQCEDELLTPRIAPNGPIVTSLGVTYIGSKDLMDGAMPAPNQIIIDDISKWREQLKIRDVSGRDWEAYYKDQSKDYDRVNKTVGIGGGDYFLTLVSLMGFEGALLAMHEDPDEVIALLQHISDFYIMIMKNQIHYLKPDLFGLMDDDAALRAPFFSLDMYHKIFKPFHKRHCDIALDAGMMITRHDCGKSEQFVDDWLEMGIVEWNSVQCTNDCVGIKKKYGDRLALAGCWDSLSWMGREFTEQEVKDALAEYVDTFAPGGRFTFFAMLGGAMDDPEANANRELVKNFYYDYAKDWYKTHA